MTEEQVFLAALELADPEDRSTYLDKACGGDAQFRRQVDELLAAHSRTGAFLDQPLGQQMEAGSSTPSSENTVDLLAQRGGEAGADQEHPEEEPDDLGFLKPSPRPE